MVTLNEGLRQIAKLADEKGWGEDVATKIYYGMIELGEAGDIWKHRGDFFYLQKIGLTLEQVNDAVAEELIDTILYCLHGLHCIEFYDPDWLFDHKMEINKERNRIYNDDVRSPEQKVNDE